MTTAVQEAYLHCQAVTRANAKNFYYAFATLPKARRQAIYAVYAFCRLCDDIADGVAPTDEKVQQLDGVQRALVEAYAGTPDSETFVALADAVRAFEIPRNYLEEVVEGVRMDLTTSRYQTFEDLRTYCYRVASTVGLVSVRLFGGTAAAIEPLAVDLGLAMQLTNIIRDVNEDLARGRVYLPLDEMARFGYSLDELRRNVYNDAFVSLMRYQGERAHAYFENGLRLVQMLPRRTRACPAVLGGMYLRLLERIEARGYNVFKERVSLSSREKLALASRIWLQSSLLWSRHNAA